MYMMWFDDGKKPAKQKIAEALEAYVRHFKTEPNTVLVNEVDQAETPPDGVTLRVSPTVRQFNYWIGRE